MTTYEMIIYWSDEDQGFIAEVPELAGGRSLSPRAGLYLLDFSSTVQQILLAHL